MKSFLINLFTPKKYKDMFKKIQQVLKGKKSYIAGAILVLQGLVKIVDTVTGLESIGQFVDWIGTVFNSEGGILIMNGLAVFGIRAGIEKNK
jgi:hypothetical protein